MIQYLALLLALALGALPGFAADAWSPTKWQNTPAWQSRSGGWLAVVSESRARLIYLGPAEGRVNLLYAPPAPAPLRPRGGHIAWLGPQAEWYGGREVWPPPGGWESAGSASVSSSGDTLTMVLPRVANLPVLSRSYFWKDRALHCQVAWSGGKGSYQVIQIVQLPPQAMVTARPGGASGGGFIRISVDGRNRRESPAGSPEIAMRADGAVQIRSREGRAKFGFPPQPLRAVIGRYSLVMERGETLGRVLDSPDAGFDTQVYVGGKVHPFVEIEQLSPRLKNAGKAENAFTVILKPGMRDFLP
ncbi:hypothetical protein TSACC_2673 [Terrimicrobium sacchariphilum]|uniref:Uncharacterized protein n=1 Tax=Terrimicrobium sacchariphilum TaxID=690879 RepID=A0A146G371_TERSA|nr:hypothetical protein [Terrimicrobium sacchariphilum]GAT32275.1 hypothetical protein TSACC_2673 [Terrimicrobium sacchariphilum]